MTCDEAHHIPKELLEISNLCKQKFGEHVWKWILRVGDIDGKDMKLYQTEFINIGSLNGDSALLFSFRS